MVKLADIKSGDVLAWKRNHRNKVSDFVLQGISFLTGQEFAHVGVALRIDGYLFVLEATMPIVRLSLVDPEEEIFHIKMPVEVTRDVQDWLISLIGLNYSIADAVRALFGKISQKDDRWQCGEIVLEYCQRMGYILEVAYTPDDVVHAICDKYAVHWDQVE